MNFSVKRLRSGKLGLHYFHIFIFVFASISVEFVLSPLDQCRFVRRFKFDHKQIAVTEFSIKIISILD